MNTGIPSATVPAILSAVLLLGPGCTGHRLVQNAAADSGHRLVRISFKDQKNGFRMRVNGGPVEKFPNTAFTNTMRGFRFEYSDIVLWEAVRNEQGAEVSEPQKVAEWWFNYLGIVRTAFYSINSDDIRDFFGSPIYHWRAPFQKPRPLPQATFYCNGKCIGQGPTGFSALLDEFLASKRSDTPLTLAPRIKNEGENDLEDLDQMCSWLRESGVEAKYGGIYPTGLTEFGRMMDGP